MIRRNSTGLGLVGRSPGPQPARSDRIASPTSKSADRVSSLFFASARHSARFGFRRPLHTNSTNTHCMQSDRNCCPSTAWRGLYRKPPALPISLSEREEISRGIAAAQSARSMARLLGRSPSTVSRELNRNGGYDPYRAALADEMAWARARRPKRCKLANNPRLRQAVASKLRLNWSPEQIAGWLQRWRVITCHTRRSIAAYLFKPAACLRKSCLVTFDRSGRSADLSGQTRMADPA